MFVTHIVIVGSSCGYISLSDSVGLILLSCSLLHDDSNQGARPLLTLQKLLARQPEETVDSLPQIQIGTDLPPHFICFMMAWGLWIPVTSTSTKTSVKQGYIIFPTLLSHHNATPHLQEKSCKNAANFTISTKLSHFLQLISIDKW